MHNSYLSGAVSCVKRPPQKHVSMKTKCWLFSGSKIKVRKHIFSFISKLILVNLLSTSPSEHDVEAKSEDTPEFLDMSGKEFKCFESDDGL